MIDYKEQFDTLLQESQTPLEACKAFLNGLTEKERDYFAACFKDQFGLPLTPINMRAFRSNLDLDSLNDLISLEEKKTNYLAFKQINLAISQLEFPEQGEHMSLYKNLQLSQKQIQQLLKEIEEQIARYRSNLEKHGWSLDENLDPVKENKKLNEILSVRDIANLLDVKERTVHRWLREGKIKAFKAGREWRVHRQDYEAWLEGNVNI